MKKQYTKQQIQEAIAYWQKQINIGNYKKVNESENKDPAIMFLEGVVNKFKAEKLSPKDWKKLDERLWEEMQEFVKEYGKTYKIELKSFSLAVDKAWMQTWEKKQNDDMFMALGDSTRQMIINAHK